MQSATTTAAIPYKTIASGARKNQLSIIDLFRLKVSTLGARTGALAFHLAIGVFHDAAYGIGITATGTTCVLVRFILGFREEMNTIYTKIHVNLL